MSAFLGPIHTWLYNKIKFQEKTVNAVLDLAEENFGKRLPPGTGSFRKEIWRI